MKRNRLLLALSVGLLGVLALAACSGGSSAPGSPISEVATRSEEKVNLNLTLESVRGTPTHLKDYDGKIRVVDFWATWCPPCRLAIPHLNKLYAKYKDRGVEVVGVSVDENPRAVKAFEEETPIQYVSLMTSDEVEKAFEPFGGVVGLPSTFVLDREGHVYKSYVGALPPEVLEKDIRALLASRSEASGG